MAGFSLGRMLRNRRAGQAKLTWNRPELRAPETISLTSDAFGHDEHMPAWSAGKGVGDNRSPQLRWTGVPDSAAELVLVMEDPDVPLPRPVVHLALAGIPPQVSSLDEGALDAGAGPFGTGAGSLRNRGYAGPRPVPGHGPHSYVFQLYAVSEPLGTAPGASPATIVAAMAGRVIVRGRLDGRYER